MRVWRDTCTTLDFVGYTFYVVRTGMFRMRILVKGYEAEHDEEFKRILWAHLSRSITNHIRKMAPAHLPG